MKRLKTLLLLACAILASSANATTFTLNTGGGNGSLAGSYPGFTLTSADNPDGPDEDNLLTYTGVIDSAQWISFAYSYTTNDFNGSSYDPAGYILNGVKHQLSPADAPKGSYVTGNRSVGVQVGDVFGWYIGATDSILGAATLTVIATVSAVPEPETYAMLLAGLGLVGFAARRKRTAA